jgi:hypothetical protein
MFDHTQNPKFPNRAGLPARLGHSEAVRLTRQEDFMATSTDLSELAQRHRVLEDELAEAIRHPSVDDLTLAELKRRKLQLKDEMARLAHSNMGMTGPA